MYQLSGRGVLIALIVSCLAGPGRAEPPLAESFRAEVARIEANPLAGITSAEAWKAHRPELARELRDMLGLDPAPERTDLKAEIRGTIDQPDYKVERLLFQSRPGLYVTANLYLPADRKADERCPAILYVCGHSKVEIDGVPYGNKTAYQHHGAWFAANGYVCLVLDTLQLGELPGLHHGTYREGMWWWQSRGYTPAGLEAWNGIRAIDYLCSRPEVDPERIGVTGRSGGGATSWWIATLDERVKAAVPVAGITDLRDQLCNPWPDGHYDGGVIEGHCDCMFPINLYRWDFTTLAALVAPRALLIENTDHDPIFPLAGVSRIYDALLHVYDWYGARDQLDLFIGLGGHDDSPEIRQRAFAFFEQHLKGKKPEEIHIDEPERKLPIEQLRVLAKGEVPTDCRNATIHESFIPPAPAMDVPASAAAWAAARHQLLSALKSRTFAGWPEPSQTPPITVHPPQINQHEGVEATRWTLTLAPGVDVPAWLFRPASGPGTERMLIRVADQLAWTEQWAPLAQAIDAGGEALTANPAWRDIKNQIESGRSVAMLAPRGIGPGVWDPARETQLRRRFALVGQTLDGMRAWDVRRALDALRSTDPARAVQKISLEAHGGATTWALWAAVFTPDITGLELVDPPDHVHDGPAYLELERILDMPQAIALMAPREVALYPAEAAPWAWLQQMQDATGGHWLTLRGHDRLPHAPAESPR